MAGKSVVAASEEQKAALRTLAGLRDRGEADRARSVLLTLSGWTSPPLRKPSAFARIRCVCGAATCHGEVAALKSSPMPGPALVKAEAALRVVTPLLEAPVADRLIGR